MTLLLSSCIQVRKRLNLSFLTYKIRHKCVDVKLKWSRIGKMAQWPRELTERVGRPEFKFLAPT